MSELSDLRDALAGEASPDFMTGARLSERLRAFIAEGDRAEVLSLLDLVGGPLALPGFAGFRSSHATLILSVVARFHQPDVVPMLERAEFACPISARPQVVRSTFEIAARNHDEAALLTGLAMAHRLVRDQVVIGPMDTPLFWLQTHPIFPERVLPALAGLAAYGPLRDDTERVRLAYAAAHPDLASPINPSLHATDLRQWAAVGDARLLSAIIDRVGATEHAAGALAYEAVVALPNSLVATWTAWCVEAEVLNGGYNQYFWNSTGRYAPEAAQAFLALGSEPYADVQRSTIATFLEHEPNLHPYRRDGTIEAFSASYKFKTFDGLDDAFMAIYDNVTVTDLLTSWLADNIDLVAADLGITD